MQAIITQYGKNKPFEVYKHVKSYEDLIATNVAFIEGRMSMTPYHLGELCEETAPLLSRLIEINKFGFVSICGQPALPEPEPQKSYIEGYLDLKYLQAFNDFMKTRPYYYQVSILCQIVIRTFPPGRYIVTPDEHCSTGIPDINICECGSWEDYPQILEILSTKAHIFIAGQEYGIGSCEDLLLDFFKSQPSVSSQSIATFCSYRKSNRRQRQKKPLNAYNFFIQQKMKDISLPKEQRNFKALSKEWKLLTKEQQAAWKND